MTITQDDIIRSLERLSPEEMESFLDRLKDRIGLPDPVAFPRVTMGMALPVVGELEYEHDWELDLLEVGPNKLAVIKVLRECRTLVLKEAKELVESAPVRILSDLSRHEADEFERRLAEAGAKVVRR